MTVTALFRDFLLENRAKQKYEKAFKYNHPQLSVEGSIKWSDDALFKVVSKRLNAPSQLVGSCGGSSYTYIQLVFALIGIRAANDVIYWRYTADGYDYWDRLALKWMSYYEKNKHLVNTKQE